MASTRWARALSRAFVGAGVAVVVRGVVAWLLLLVRLGAVMLTTEAALWMAAAGGGAVCARLSSAPE